jgi:hypothetical protein
MKFKEQLAKDLDTFINGDEFAQIHEFNGKQLLCVLESNENQKRTYNKVNQFNDGLVEYDVSLIYKYDDYPYTLAYNTEVKLNGVRYTVINFAYDDGICTVKLQGVTA